MDTIKFICTLIPFIWTIGMIPFVNQVRPLVFGLPFLAFWMIAGIFVAFFCIQVVYYIDTRSTKD